MKNIRTPMTVCACVLLLGCTTSNPSNLTSTGLAPHHPLEPCPKTPNCVSSLESTNNNYVAPLRYTGKMEVAHRKLAKIIESDQRAKIVTIQENYIKVEYRSAFLGFIDDVEFFFSSKQPMVEVRSASRAGYYDFGVNRKRIAKIRQRWTEPPTPSAE